MICILGEAILSESAIIALLFCSLVHDIREEKELGP